jgi:NtrC-family two-component system response regulator AlgB
MSAALDRAALAAQSDAAVLLRGESGTGKGVLARFIHEQSERRGRRFIIVSGPTLNDELLASELFGHARGAFTGAVKDTAGRVEVADGGTLFLDEVGEISPQLQTKLLRFTQDREYERVGDTTTRRADVRIIAATNRDLDADVAAGRFRLDLLYRLNVVELTVPPLRERSEDLLALAEHFLAFFATKMGRVVPSLTDEAKAALLSYPWPGNIRELRNETERAIVLSRQQTLGPRAFSERIAGTPIRAEPGTPMTLEELERLHIERVLAKAATREEAAERLGIDVSTLWRKRKRYGLDE